ncbi:MAG: SLC13 family permease [Chloroflexota bacterium]
MATVAPREYNRRVMIRPELLLILILIAAAVLFIATRLRPDLVALITLVALGLSGLVTPDQAFSGFSASAVITILSIFFISEGLQQTGVTHVIGRHLLRFSGGNERQAVLVTTLAAATLSLFMNNIAAAGVLLPAVISLSRQSNIAPSKLLMPLAFGTILGGMATLLTTANIIVSGTLRQAGLEPFNLLDFLPVGLLVVGAGAAYMVLVGRRLLPARYPAGLSARAARLRAELAGLYGLEKSLCEVVVQPGSPLAELTLWQGDWAQRCGLSIVALARNGHIVVAPAREEIVLAGDVLLAQGNPSPESLAAHGLRLLSEPSIPLELTDAAHVLGEVVLSPHARMAGKSLKDIHFREKYGLNVLALWRQGKPIRTGISDLALQPGDALLLQGAADRFRYLREERDFILLEEDPDAVLRPRKMRLAAIISLLTLIIAALGLAPIAVVTMSGALALLLTGCLTMDEAYRAVEWKAVFLVAGIWPLGTALTTTGLANRLASTLANVSGSAGPLALAALLMAAATVLNQLVGGQAVVPILLAPVALAVAQASGTDPRGMGMAVALGASLAFLTPVAHPVNTLVMGSGGYAYRDYLRVGGPLTLLTFLVILVGLRLFWNL